LGKGLGSSKGRGLGSFHPSTHPPLRACFGISFPLRDRFAVRDRFGLASGSGTSLAAARETSTISTTYGKCEMVRGRGGGRRRGRRVNGYLPFPHFFEKPTSLSHRVFRIIRVGIANMRKYWNNAFLWSCWKIQVCPVVSYE